MVASRKPSRPPRNLSCWLASLEDANLIFQGAIAFSSKSLCGLSVPGEQTRKGLFERRKHMTTKPHHDIIASPSNAHNVGRAKRARQVLWNYTDECDMSANLVDLLADI